jgi:hypothetical protein
LRVRLALSILLLALVNCSSRSVVAVHRDLLNRNGHLIVSRALAEGRKSAQFLLACDPQSTDKVTRTLRASGATVYKTLPSIGYLRAEIPLGRLDAVMQNTAIQQIDVLGENQFDYDLQGRSPPTEFSADVPPLALPTPGPHTPHANPFTGLSDMGVPQFLQEYPSFDGRGTVVGILEAPDPRAPGLQWARALDGRLVPKFVGYRVAEGPNDLYAPDAGPHNVELGWVDMNREVVAGGNGRFLVQDAAYRAPYPGKFRFGSLSVRNLYIQFHITQASNRTSAVPRGVFPVLWDESNGKVWVNASGDGDFARDRPISDFSGPADIGSLPLQFVGWKTYRFPGAYLISSHFVVQTDTNDHFVRIEFVGLGTHSTMIAGSATAAGLFHGAFDGVAPGAQISVVDGEYPFLIEALAKLAASKVNVISTSFGLTPYVEAGGVTETMVDRIVRTYNVPIVVAAANDGPAIQTLETPSTSSAAISVGGYVSAETARYDEGAVFPPISGMLANYSSRGPAADGALKPDVIAATEWLTSSSTEAPSGSFRQSLRLPPGYTIGSGTSQAAPAAAGAVALLTSAAKQSGLAPDADLIKRALVTTGRTLPYRRADIGGGLIDMPAAWGMLRRLLASPPPHIEAAAPVRTVVSDELSTPNVGRGLYEREGWRPGMTGIGNIAYTLVAGSSSISRTYAVRVVGETDTFQTASTLTLLPDTPVQLAVRISPQTAGLHSAIIELIDERSQIVVDERLCTVIAAEQFSHENGFTIIHHDFVEHPGFRRYFFDVPVGATALSLHATATSMGLAGRFDPSSAADFLQVRMPNGVEPPILSAYPPINEGKHWADTFSQPMSGVWEVDVVNDNPSYFSAIPQRAASIPPTHYVLRAEIYSVATRSTAVGRSSVRLDLENHSAPFTLDGASVAVADVKNVFVRLHPEREQVLVPLDIPTNTVEAFARLVRVSGAGSDVSVYLFNCAKNIVAQHNAYFYSGKCSLAATANSHRGDGIASTARPTNFVSALFPQSTLPAGRWTVVVDGFHLPAPVSVSLELGEVARAANISRLLKPHRVAAGRTLQETLPLPARKGGASVALIRLQAAEALSIWQNSTAETIAEMESSKPNIERRSETVWSEIVPLTNP